MTPEPIGTAGIECLHCHTTFRVFVYAAPTSYLFHPPGPDGAVQVDEICEMTTAPLDHDCTAGAA
jgi:hypothetical protein